MNKYEQELEKMLDADMVHFLRAVYVLCVFTLLKIKNVRTSEQTEEEKT